MYYITCQMSYRLSKKQNIRISLLKLTSRRYQDLSHFLPNLHLLFQAITQKHGNLSDKD